MPDDVNWRSETNLVISGVSRGSVLGPLLFPVYIDDVTIRQWHNFLWKPGLWKWSSVWGKMWLRLWSDFGVLVWENLMPLSRLSCVCVGYWDMQNGGGTQRGQKAVFMHSLAKGIVVCLQSRFSIMSSMVMVEHKFKDMVSPWGSE